KENHKMVLSLPWLWSNSPYCHANPVCRNYINAGKAIRTRMLMINHILIYLSDSHIITVAYLLLLLLFSIYSMMIQYALCVTHACMCGCTLPSTK
ncbi:hypothetical protein T310_7990, partial [Rasamsonia emersonii CBS 393.64]